MTDHKIVVVGIDGATFAIIKPLVKEGRLPNLKRLMEEGAHGVLNSTVPPVSPVAWTSFMTGTVPDKHGIFDFSGKDPGTYRFRINTAGDRRTAPVWSYLSEARKRVFVAGVTMTFPPDAVNGYMVSGLGAPPNADARALAYPPEYGAEIESRFGRYLMVPEADLRILHRSDQEKRKYLEGIFAQVDYRVNLFKYMWAKEEFDFSMLFFLDTDGISHYFWKYMDSQHLQHQRGDFTDAIVRVYQKIDAALGEMMAVIGDRAGLVLVSDHGFGPMNRVLFLNNWLASRGYLTFRRASPIATAAAKVASIVRGVERRASREIDWEKTRAYFSGTVGNIFVNLQGREPAGIVDPADYAALCNAIVKDLTSYRDPGNGETIIDQAFIKGSAEQARERTSPDIVVTFRKGYGVVGDEIALHDMADTGEIVADARNWSGNHEKEGIFIAWGGPFKRGYSFPEAEIVDVAPTILYALQVPIPTSMDGRALQHVFTDDFTGSREVLISGDLEAAGTAAKSLDDAERQAIEEQLRNLGYLE